MIRKHGEWFARLAGSLSAAGLLMEMTITLTIGTVAFGRTSRHLVRSSQQRSPDDIRLNPLGLLFLVLSNLGLHCWESSYV
jgi:hypothetical protein